MIKELTELVALCEQALPNPEELLTQLSRQNRDAIRLYHAVQTHTFRTEADAIQKSNVGERTKFRQVARELLRCLEQMVLQIGFEKETFDPLNNGRFRGFQLTAISKSLAIVSCKYSSRKAAEELMRIGLEYARPEFVVEAAKSMMNYISVSGESTQAFDEYYGLYRAHSEWRSVEEKALVYVDWVTLSYGRKKALQRHNAPLVQQFLDELEPHMGIIPSHNFHMSYFLLLSMRHQIEADYRAASVSNDRAIEYFQSREYPCAGALRVFYYHGIINCVYLGQYEKGEHYLRQALDRVLIGTIHWFNTLEIGFYLKMHHENYQAAAELYHLAVRHKRFHAQRETLRETWNILGAYLFIVEQLKGMSLSEARAPKVKSSRFRNEVKDFSQDKTGMNIAILAAEILLELVEGKEDGLWDRVAALEKYRERYLRNGDDTHRSQLFIKILVILAKYNYDGEKFLDKAQPYISELRTVPLRITSQAHELEIVPYEKLVRMIVEFLVKSRGKNPGARFVQKLERAVGQ